MYYLLNPKPWLSQGLSLWSKIVKDPDFPYLPALPNLHVSSVPSSSCLQEWSSNSRCILSCTILFKGQNPIFTKEYVPRMSLADFHSSLCPEICSLSFPKAVTGEGNRQHLISLEQSGVLSLGAGVGGWGQLVAWPPLSTGLVDTLTKSEMGYLKRRRNSCCLSTQLP